jgi:hypothetical protein
MSIRMSLNISRDTATSAIWNAVMNASAQLAEMFQAGVMVAQ